MQKLTIKGRNIVYNNHWRFHYPIQINAQNIQAKVRQGNIGQKEHKKPIKPNTCTQYSTMNILSKGPWDVFQR